MIPLFRDLEDVSEEQIELDVANCPLNHMRIIMFQGIWCEACDEEHGQIMTLTLPLN